MFSIAFLKVALCSRNSTLDLLPLIKKRVMENAVVLVFDDIPEMLFTNVTLRVLKDVATGCGGGKVLEEFVPGFQDGSKFFHFLAFSKKSVSGLRVLQLI